MPSKQPVGGSEQQTMNGSGNPMPFHVFNIDPEGGLVEKEWSVIATMRQKGEVENWMRISHF